MQNLNEQINEIEEIIAPKFYGLKFYSNGEVIEDPNGIFELAYEVKKTLYSTLSSEEISSMKKSLHSKKEITKCVFTKMDILEYLINEYSEIQSIFGKKCYLEEMYSDFKLLSNDVALNDLETIIALENRLNFTIVMLEQLNCGIAFPLELYSILKHKEDFENHIVDLLISNPELYMSILLSFLYYINKEFLMVKLYSVKYKKDYNTTLIKRNYDIILSILRNTRYEVTEEIINKIKTIYNNK